MQTTPQMTSQEIKGVASLASIMSLRLIGLFMILPVLSLYALHLTGATPFLIGLAMGIYGLSQALFQIPFGMLSDYWGRKPLILIGLLIFILGSVLSAWASNIYLLILGRTLQGIGAVGSTIVAAMADITSEAHRSKAMAINGMCIGASFGLAMIIGPLLVNAIHVPGIFILAAIFGGIGILVLLMALPKHLHSEFHADAEFSFSHLTEILKDKIFMKFHFGIFILHTIFSASFVVLPISLETVFHLTAGDQAWIFVPCFFLAFVLSFVMLGISERKRLLPHFSILSFAMIFLAEGIFATSYQHLYAIIFCLLFFFTGFSFLEASLPSWISRMAPKTRKGTLLGIFSFSQYLGFFVGGSFGGYLYGALGISSVYGICLFLGLLGMALAFKLKNPQYAKTPQASSH